MLIFKVAYDPTPLRERCMILIVNVLQNNLSYIKSSFITVDIGIAADTLPQFSRFFSRWL